MRLLTDLVLAFYVLALCAAGLGCPRPPSGDTGPVSGFTDAEPPPPPPVTTEAEPPPPVLECPGETQCPCIDGRVSRCPAGQVCGPTGACTHPCSTDRECLSGVSGESCIATAAGGLCGVPCDLATPTGGCPEAGMLGATCVTVGPGDHVCGYVY